MSQSGGSAQTPPGTWIVLASGARVRIVGGTVEYDPNGAFASLRSGDVASDSFSYTIRLANGTTSTATVTVSIAGEGEPVTINGFVADGYIANAIVFVDVDRDGIHDSDEASAETNGNGEFTIVTDQTGPIVAYGGTNLDTGLPNRLTLQAPEGSTIVNPLTTLVQTLAAQGLAVEDAQDMVAAAFGLPAELDLLSYDILAAAPDDPVAVKAQQAAVSVVTLIVAGMDVAGAEDAAAAESGLLAGLATLLTAGGTIDLADEALVVELLGDALPEGAEVEAAAALVAGSNAIVAAATSLDGISQAQAGQYDYGTEADDYLVGDLGDNSVYGLGGDDYLDGWEYGTDFFDGGAGTDTAALFFRDSPTGVTFAFTGNQTIETSYGIKTLRNAEQAEIEGSHFDDHLTGGTGDDHIRGNMGEDFIDGGAGIDVVHMWGKRTDYRFEMIDSTTMRVVDLSYWKHTGTDIITNVEKIWLPNGAFFTFAELADDSGTPGDDTILGGDQDDALEATSGGNDFIDGGAGTDIVRISYAGDAAAAHFFHSDSPYTFSTAGGAKTLFNIEAVHVTGSDHRDLLWGASGDDMLDGGVGPDSLHGWGGNDVFLADMGDFINGGDGTDEVVLEGHWEDYSIEVSPHPDYIRIVHLPTGESLDMTMVERLTVRVGGTMTLALRPPFVQTGVPGTPNESFSGTYLDDIVLGGDGNDYIPGWTQGNDLLDGGSGDDRVYITFYQAPEGVDFAFTGNQTVYTAGGYKTLVDIDRIDLGGSVHDDRFTGGGGDDSINGWLGDDELDGGGGADNLQGWDGDDLLRGGSGSDTLAGGAGRDLFVFEAGGGNDLVADFDPAADQLALSGVAVTGWTAVAVDGVESLRMSYAAPGGAGAGTVTLKGITIQPQVYNLELGGSGQDHLFGTPSDDLIVGGDGPDLLGASSPGNDVIDGGEGYDFVYLDFTDSPAGASVVFTGNQTLTIRGGTKTLIDTEGVYMGGSDFDDVFIGAAGHDSLRGNNGDDVLVGGDGWDYLTGDAGNDVMTGGAGTDEFRLAFYETGNDVVTDFELGIDRFLVSSDVSLSWTFEDVNGDGVTDAIAHYQSHVSAMGSGTFTFLGLDAVPDIFAFG